MARRKVGDMRAQRDEMRRLAKEHAQQTAAAIVIQKHGRRINAMVRVRNKRRIWSNMPYNEVSVGR